MEKSKIRTLLFCLLFSFTTALSKHRCHQVDENTLLKVKNSLNNPHSLSTWDPKTDCCSSWSGVTCSDTVNYRVTGILIGADDKISAHIPPELGDLKYLKKLVFQMVPNLTGEIPPTIANLKNLETLWFSGTGISGHIPAFLSQLTNLQVLELSVNKLTGSIPSIFSMLPKLTSLAISDNKLTGTIPDSFPRKLNYLDVSNNQLSGTIPKSLGNFDFYYIDVSQNKLQGDASMLFGASKKKTYFINISKNMFHFKLSNVKITDALTQLDVSHNIITGQIPAQWTEATDLQVLNVSYNKLCGRIPTGGNLQNFDSSSYFHNKCLCGAPLPSCK